MLYFVYKIKDTIIRYDNMQDKVILAEVCKHVKQ
jgi:hypothetical protein